MRCEVLHWYIVAKPALLFAETLTYAYPGTGSDEDPYIVDFVPRDPCDPMHFADSKKWLVTLLNAVAIFVVTFGSSVYAGTTTDLKDDFNASTEVVTLGLSLYVLGFGLGPLLWAPLSEHFGRQIVAFISYGLFVVFNGASVAANSIITLVVLRFFAGGSGSSVLTNGGGVIADMFPPAQRGLAVAIYAAAPLMSPTLGPTVGGFLGESSGWRWVMALLALLSVIVWVVFTINAPETYAPALLEKRAMRLSKLTGMKYRSHYAAVQRKSVSQALRKALSMPWKLMYYEPIVLILVVYVAIIFGTLYLLFAAFPVVYQENRGWSPGLGGLAFTGVGVGMLLGVLFSIFLNRRYQRRAEAAGGSLAPEARLDLAMVGAIALPIGLFAFAWTNDRSIHWIVSISAIAPFGFGFVLVFQSVINYLVDAYTKFAASALAANALLRSLFGAAFPFLAIYLYDVLDPQWASSIPAFLAAVCTPFPFVFHKYGRQIRKKCKYAAAAAND